MRPNGGRGGAWHLTFTLSPADGTIAPQQESSEFFINHKKIFKLKILKMKKHFLLLLMAFMSMTTWAQPTVTTAPVGATGLTYDGSAKALVATEGVATPDGEGTVTFYYQVVAKDAAAPAFDKTKWLTKANVKQTNAGSYDVYFVAYQTDALKTAPAKVEDGEGNPITVTIAAKHFTAAGTTMSTPADKVYTGKDQAEAFLAEFTVTDKALGKAIAADDLTITYQVYDKTAEDFVATDKIKDAGSYKLKVEGKGNYTGEMLSKAFKVTPAELVVKVKDLSTFYTGVAKTGADFEITYDGFVNGETEGGVFTAPYEAPAVANDKKDAGTYDILAEGGSAANYTFVFVKGKLTIAPAKVRISALATLKAPLGSEEAAITSWTGKEYFSVDEDGHLATKFITMELQNGTDDDGATYAVPMAINKFADYVATEKYEVPQEVGDPLVKNFIKGLTLTRTSGTGAGEYPVTASGATAKTANYEIVYKEGKFTIGKAEATITVDNVAKAYGDEDPELTYTITGVDEAAVAAIKEKITITRAEGEDVGSYDITLTVADNTSFSDFTVPAKATAKFMITKRGLKITAMDQVLYTGMTIDDLDQTAVTIVSLAEGEELELELDFSAAVKKLVGDGGYMNALEVLTKAAMDGVAGGIVVSIADNAANKAILKNYQEPVLVAGKLTIIEAAQVLYLDDTNASLDNAIKEAKDAKRIVKFSSRTLKKDQWNTLVLPFETTVAKISEKFNYAVVDMLAESTSPETISLKLAFGKIPANTPFLVQPAADVKLETITFDGGDGTGETIKYSNAPEANDGQGHYFKGTYVGHNVTSADKSEYYYSSTKKSFVNSSKSTKIGIMRAYLKDTNAASAGARIITIEEPDGSTTAISTIENENNNANGAIYNLQGVRVNKAGKGVYIQNGKKYIK